MKGCLAVGLTGQWQLDRVLELALAVGYCWLVGACGWCCGHCCHKQCDGREHTSAGFMVCAAAWQQVGEILFA